MGTTAPRCNTPAPQGSTDCAACGWDLREAYHPESEAAATP